MPMPRWDWHTVAEPPGPRVSRSPRRREDEPEPLWPAADETPRFERHIRPLFRRGDRQSMSFAFDLWSHDDVSQHAPAILDLLAAGTMPCDSAWRRRKSSLPTLDRGGQTSLNRWGRLMGSHRFATRSGRRAAFSGRSAST